MPRVVNSAGQYVCENGQTCVCARHNFGPAILSRYNPGRVCHACSARAKYVERELKREAERRALIREMQELAAQVLRRLRLRKAVSTPVTVNLNIVMDPPANPFDPFGGAPPAAAAMAIAHQAEMSRRRMRA